MSSNAVDEPRPLELTDHRRESSTALTATKIEQQTTKSRSLAVHEQSDNPQEKDTRRSVNVKAVEASKLASIIPENRVTSLILEQTPLSRRNWFGQRKIHATTFRSNRHNRPCMEPSQ